jgi:type 2 lantibiotic biosynthesis protein LanM
MGALIGIVYMLNGNDCHMENLIAAGAYPMLIDFESVMHHEGKMIDNQFDGSANSLLSSQFGFSVFRTGLLPSWKRGKDGYAFDVSGMGGYNYNESPYQQIRWHGINSDSMRMSFVPVVFQEQQNIPVYQGQKQLPANHVSEIVSGFTDLYRLLVKHRSQIPLHLFEGKDLRFIFRSSLVYALTIKSLMNPKYMREGLERSIQQEMLCRPFLHNPESGLFWALSKSEMRQMEDTDIPIFWAGSGVTGLKDPYGIVYPDFMRKAACDQVADMVSEMDENDLRQQVKFIRAALFFRDVQHNQVKIPEENKITATEEIHPASTERLMDAATKIAETLQSEAIFSKDGSCTWITAGMLPGSERFRSQPISFDLYDGLQGVALFLSALLSVKDDPALRRLNEATVLSLRAGFTRIKQYGMGTSAGMIGVASGMSSAIYTLVKLSGFLRDPSFIEDAISVCHLLPPSVIQKDTYHDIIAGSAGCIVGMLSLYNQTGHQEALEKADLCGRRLLKNMRENKDGTCGWNSTGGKMLSGFSHGQAGIAYALLKLFECTGINIYRDTAERAIRYENTLFSREVNNWADLRTLNDLPGAGPSYMWSWCHGAPGIGLARLASQHILNNTEVETDIRNAIHGTLELSVNATYRDHLCCGNMGLADILLYFAAKTGDRGLLIGSGKKTNRVLHAAEKNGHYNLLFGAGEDLINPGFFQGISGIGYALLRQACPEKFPSILIFE